VNGGTSTNEPGTALHDLGKQKGKTRALKSPSCVFKAALKLSFGPIEVHYMEKNPESFHQKP